MHFAGRSLNVMTLGGLALGIGMLVDSSIVVLESIQRKRDEGFGEGNFTALFKSIERDQVRRGVLKT